MLLIQENIAIPLEEFTFTCTRSSGPGGQNVNKVASRVTLFWNPSTSPTFGTQTEAIDRLHQYYPSYFSNDGVLILSSQLTRDMPRNRQDCLEKLCVMLQRALRKPKRRVPTLPSRAAHQRRLDSKAHNAQKKQNRRSPSSDI